MTSSLDKLKDIIRTGDRQNKRLLVLTFPNNDAPAAPLLVNRLDATEGLSRDFKFTVELLSTDARMRLKSMMGKLLCISLVRSDGTLRYFTGYIFQFRFVRTDGGAAVYEAVLRPWLYHLRQGKNNAVFRNATLRDQTERVLRQHAVSMPDWSWQISSVHSLDTPMTAAIQFGESDHNYLHRRWEAMGWLYYYEHCATGHRLVITDDSYAVPAIDGASAQIRYQRDAGSVEVDGISEWSPSRHYVAALHSVSSFDFKAPVRGGRVDCIDSPTGMVQGDVLPSEAYEYGGAYALRSQQQRARLIRLRTEETNALGKHIDAAGNNVFVMPGRWFCLTHHFDASTERGKNDYLIVDVTHSAANNYFDDASTQNRYSNELTCIRRAVPWRPGREFNSTDTKIYGPQTATVIAAEAMGDIHTDEYGRALVRFPWDRSGEQAQNMIAFVRVATCWAGSEMGLIGMLRVGFEVVVVFLGGNPDMPLIIGCVYGNDNMPPWALANQQALLGWRTRELTPHGGNMAGGRSNHLLLDDTNENIQVQLKTDAYHSSLSMGHITRVDGNAGRQDAQGRGIYLFTEAWSVIRAGLGMLLTTESRPGGNGPAKGLQETVRRLTAAQQLQEGLGSLAQQLGAQEVGQQDGVSKELQAANDALTGSAGDFPELSTPQLVLASPAGISATTTRSTHVASGEHTALTAGKDLSLAAGGSLFASIRQTVRLFVERKGIKAVAAAGDIDLQALKDGINLLAKLNISVVGDNIDISAKGYVSINGGGSYTKWQKGSIESGTDGNFIAHAADHSLLGPKSKQLPSVMPPLAKLDGHGLFHLGSHALAAGRPGRGLPYKLYKDGALLEEGQIDSAGNLKFKHELDAKSCYALELAHGQRYVIDPNAHEDRHEVSSGLGFHGYSNEAGSLSDSHAPLDIDRLVADPGNPAPQGKRAPGTDSTAS